jgi:hypothetical protein
MGGEGNERGKRDTAEETAKEVKHDVRVYVYDRT